jgi:hypothetical protein
MTRFAFAATCSGRTTPRHFAAFAGAAFALVARDDAALAGDMWTALFE